MKNVYYLTETQRNIYAINLVEIPEGYRVLGDGEIIPYDAQYLQIGDHNWMNTTWSGKTNNETSVYIVPITDNCPEGWTVIRGDEAIPSEAKYWNGKEWKLFSQITRAELASNVKVIKPKLVRNSTFTGTEVPNGWRRLKDGETVTKGDRSYDRHFGYWDELPYCTNGDTPRFPHEIITPIESSRTEGGRGITNFIKSNESIYRAAIAACSQFKLAIRKYPMYGKNGYLTKEMIEVYYCLIETKHNGDLSKFWRVYEAIRDAKS